MSWRWVACTYSTLECSCSRVKVGCKTLSHKNLDLFPQLNCVFSCWFLRRRVAFEMYEWVGRVWCHSWERLRCRTLKWAYGTQDSRAGSSHPKLLPAEGTANQSEFVWFFDVPGAGKTSTKTQQLLDSFKKRPKPHSTAFENLVLGLLACKIALQHCRVASTGRPHEANKVQSGRAKITEE